MTTKREAVKEWFSKETPIALMTFVGSCVLTIGSIVGTAYFFGGQVAEAKSDITDLQKADIAMQEFLIRESEKNDRSADEMKALIKEVRDNQFAMMQDRRVPTNERQR